MRYRIALAAILIALPAQAAEDARDEEVTRLQEKVKDLEARLSSLEDPKGASAELAELKRQVDILGQEVERLRVGEAAAVTADHSIGGYGPAASKVYATEKGVAIGGYGEILYEGIDSEREDGEPSGRKSQVDFYRAIVYFGYKFNDKILFNSELEVEHANTEEDGAVEMEFGYLDFKARDEIGVRAGMVLLPLGIINELHEPPTYLSARRPLVENRIIPTTWSDVGLGVFGDIADFSYRAYVVNGMDAVDGYAASGIRGGRQKGSRALAEDLALTGRLDWHGVDGLTLGASFYTGDAGQGNVAPLSGKEIGARTTLFDLHASYHARGLYARALYAASRVEDAALLNEARELTGDDSVGSRQKGYYAELGYDVLSFMDDVEQELIPFARFEALDTQDEVPAGFAADPANDVAITTIGLAWKPLSRAVVKLDFQDVGSEAETGVDQFNLGLGWMF